MALSVAELRGEFTHRIIDVYQERIRPTDFIRQFFPSKFSPTKGISVDIERTTEKVAVDVVRGSEGNFNRFSLSSQKLYVPPFWREYFNATDLDIYDQVLGSQSTDNSQLFAELLNQVADKVMALQDKIERAKNRQCVQVFESGIVTLVNGDNIDFKRRAASFVDLNSGSNGGYWYSNNDPFPQFAAGCEFIRKFGKHTSMRFVAVFGSRAISDLFNNTKFTARQDLVNLKLDEVARPRANGRGGVYHGTITAGPYTVELWSWPDFYEDDNGTMQAYLNQDRCTLLPPDPRFQFSHCLVPQLVAPGSTKARQTGEYLYGDFIDERRAHHDFDVQCAGVPVPIAIDQMYTMQTR